MHVVPKTIGADIELGNALIEDGHSDNLRAAVRLVAEVRSIPAFSGLCRDDALPTAAGEWGRHWLSNGGCLYVDMSHAECALLEAASARNHVAAFHAALRIVRACRRRVQRRLAPGDELFVNAHVADGTRQTSWGSHVNLLVSRRLWEQLFCTKPHVQALLASFVAASMPLFGQGYLLPDASGACRYALSARAHHIGEVTGLATTVPFRRNLLNSRDEPHAPAGLARLHLIAFDTLLQPAGLMARSGLLQIVAAALELGWFDYPLLLDDPVAAAQTWSQAFDAATGLPAAEAVRRVAGRSVTLLEWHRRLLVQLQSLLVQGRLAPGIVPDAAAILDLYAQILSDLADGDADALASRLDWALKWQLIAHELRRTHGSPSDPPVRLIDQLYSHVDDQVGLYWHFWRNGLVDRAGIDDRRIGHFVTAGDPRTRSALRGELVRRLRPWISSLDWGYIELSSEARDASWWSSRRLRLSLGDPAVASGALVAWLRRHCPSDEQLRAWFIEQADELAPAAPPVGEPRPAANYGHWN